MYMQKAEVRAKDIKVLSYKGNLGNTTKGTLSQKVYGTNPLHLDNLFSKWELNGNQLNATDMTAGTPKY